MCLVVSLAAPLHAQDAKYHAAVRAALRERASRMLLLADREDQMRAASAQLLLQKHGGKPLDAADFGMLDENTKYIIVTYVPDLMPDALLPSPNQSEQPAQAQASAPADKEDNSQKARSSSLTDKLANTRWNYPTDNPDIAPSLRWFTLNADMTVQAGWHTESCWWKVLDDSSIVMTVNHKQSHTRTLTFNKDLTEATDGKGLKYHRLDTSAAE